MFLLGVRTVNWVNNTQKEVRGLKKVKNHCSRVTDPQFWISELDLKDVIEKFAMTNKKTKIENNKYELGNYQVIYLLSGNNIFVYFPQCGINE